MTKKTAEPVQWQKAEHQCAFNHVKVGEKGNSEEIIHANIYPFL